MNIFGKDAEQALIDFMNQLRANPQKWRALHFHFSALQPDHRQSIQMQTVTNIIHAEMGQYIGSVYICHDSDMIVVFESAATAAVETMITNLRFLFSDDPLASSSYVSGEHDTFYTSYDLSFAYDQFFYMCLHKLSMINPEQNDDKHVTAEHQNLPPVALFQKMSQDRLERKQLKILVAEDSYFSRQMIRQALLPNKHDVLLAKDGWEALAQYLSHAPNIAFLDIDMPQMTGLDVLGKVSSFDKAPFIVMLTASNLSNDIKNAISHGAKGYIVKPFTVGKLTAYVDQYCREHNLPPTTR